MEEGGVTLGEINISGRREEARTEVKISSVRISTREIKALPSTGGETGSCAVFIRFAWGCFLR